MREMACELVGDIVLCLHTTVSPDDASWQTYVDACLAAAARHDGDFARVRQLVFTDGAGPNGAQRQRIVDAIEPLRGAKEGRVAVVSSSAAVRGIVTVFNWFNFAVRAFSPIKLDEAMTFLSISPSETEMVRAAADHMSATLNGGVPRSLASLLVVARPRAATVPPVAH